VRAETGELNAGFFPPERVERDLRRLRSLLTADQPTLILCDNEGQLERLDELLSEGSGRANATLAIGALEGGFVMRSLRVLTDHEIFRRARRIRRARRYRQAAPGAATGQLQAGDYVVHLDHGIGIYRGIDTIQVGEATLEVAIVEYEGGDRLNVPLYRLDQLERYRAAGAPPERLTISSDAGGCLPTFDHDGRLCRMDVGASRALPQALRTLLARGHALDAVLPAFTSNVARLLRLAGKGVVVAGGVADLVVLDADGGIADVMAQGAWHVRDGAIVRRGLFE